MLPTEVQRILLLIGLAATAYLMILAWNEDYMQAPAETGYSAAPEPQGVDAGAPLVESPIEESAAGESDVPDASLIPDTQIGVAQEAAETVDTGRLIKVTTDVLVMWIDRLGGDVVRVELPAYPEAIDRPEVPFILLDNGNGRTYIAQSGLIGEDGIDGGGSRPLYESRQTDYQMGTGEVLRVALETSVDGLKVVKSYEFRRGDYLVDMAYRVENTNSRPIQASLFAQIKRGAYEPPGGGSFSMGPQPYLGAALTTAETRYQKIEFEDLDEERFRESVVGGWIAFLQHYFLSAWVADPTQENNFYGNRRTDGTYVFGYTSPLQTVPAGAVGEWSSQFYAGPKDQLRLEQISENLNLTVDYGFLWWLAVPLFYLLDWLHGLVGNWGVAIILLTVLVKLVLYPLSAASYRSMANMRRVGPQMKRLQERHADDRQKLSQEMMALYKKEKVNPLGGCLPMLLPMPIFIALYWVLFESVELRQAPFFLWINDLAAKDPYFVLPLLMGASMFVQQSISPAVGDPMQVRMMKMMPIMFTVLFLFFPAGLVLYWLVNNLLGLAQQWFVMRQVENAAAAKT
jgi:YidC/Oxa1 family membrane protein insertase